MPPLRPGRLLIIAATCLIVLAASVEVDSPSSRGESSVPVHVYEEDDALITCIVRQIGKNTVVWKRKEGDRWKVLTAGMERVAPDPRFQVIHDQGGDVWVLAVKEVRQNDSGVYSCEVNSLPEVRTLHHLKVLSRDLVPPSAEGSVTPAISVTVGGGGSSERSGNHNYTDCCIALNVTTSCLGFCNIQSILEGTTGQDPEHCEADFQSIVRCMADGRNHVPCCVEEKVPDICQDVCRGEYTIITDNIKTHFSCAAYTEQTLACIAEGIELLPSQPLDVDVTALTDRSFGVSWKPPYQLAENLTEYTVNVTMLRSFDPASLVGSDSEAPDESNSSQSIVTPHSVQVNVKVTDNQSNYVVIKELSPFTMYEITVIAKNKHGSSLPSNPVRSLTLAPGKVRSTGSKRVPQLPAVKSCCQNQGVNQPHCVDKLCGLHESEGKDLEVASLMICAPWADKAFACLSNGVDNSRCCRARGLPSVCLDLCSGNITSFDFSYFRCIKHMPDYVSCLMDGYGVLPGEPRSLRVTNVGTDFALVHWDPPLELPDTVVNYNLYYRPLKTDREYSIIPNVNPPMILEGLEVNTPHEVYVSAANAHGIGDPSERVIFTTRSEKYEEAIETDPHSYNVTECCANAGLSTPCMPLCSYDASMSQLKALAGVCGAEFYKLIRCGAGGRNHGACCSRRGVPSPCLTVCSGALVQSLVTTTATCIPYIGNIVQCFEEGTDLLPGPISELHAIKISDSEIDLAWEPPSGGANVTDYIVHYTQVDNTSLHETPLKLDNQITTKQTVETLRNLEKGKIYKIFVVSRNPHGTSLPSSILLINATATDVGEKGVAAVTSSPHSLAVSSHSATYVTISWQPPEFSQPAEQLIYRVFYKASSDPNFSSSETTVTSHTLENLNPNTQYIFYITAILPKKGQSLPSETLIAWTDPAYPAFVEPPTVHPINLVVEGSSMTILCIAMGTPMPTISLYISGRLVRQDITRHMVTVVHNVTRDMDLISCYADNGYGTPMEARRRIIISYKPQITASGIKMATHGETVTLECYVESHPDPKMMFWKDYAERIPIIPGPKYEVNISRNKEDEDKWTMQLTIKDIKDADGGEYFCQAENAFGNATKAVSVRLRNLPSVSNVTQCCMEQNVSSPCMDACTFYLDFDAVINKISCIGDFDKLMKCAADGSDHRSCCAHSGVERGCLDWCRGEPLLAEESKVCLLQHTKRIISCFREGRDRLPGPPQNVRVERLDDHSVLVKWDPPLKNPHTVEVYRVFWRPANSRNAPYKNDSKTTSLRVGELKSGTVYECVVKAGNSRGASALTEPVKFSTDEKYITSAASVGEESSQFGMAAGLVLMTILLVGGAAGGVWYLRTKRLLGHKSGGGVAFENPSYLREVNMEVIQPGDGSGSGGGRGGSGQNGWNQEPLQVPSSTEVAPSLYEELKLGQDGAGFKRLKP